MPVTQPRLWVPDRCWWPEFYTGPADKRVTNVTQFCNRAVELGGAVELVPLKDVLEVRRRGIAITCHLPELSTGAPAYRIGLCNSPDQVKSIVLPAYRQAFETAAPGEKIIVFTGVVKPEKRTGDERKQLVGHLQELGELAEKLGVIAVLEHLNDKGGGDPDSMLGHDDYVGSDMEWVAAVIREVNSLAVRILFDQYHVDIMHPGRLLTLLRALIDLIGQIHTAGVVGGVPSRVALDSARQQTNFPELAATLTELEYSGGVGLEYLFNDTRDPLDSIKSAFKLLGC